MRQILVTSKNNYNVGTFGLAEYESCELNHFLVTLTGEFLVDHHSGMGENKP